MRKVFSKVIQKILAVFNLKLTRTAKTADNVVVYLRPNRRSVGNVLLGYIIEPFLLKPGEPVSNEHTHDWESLRIAQTFLEMGYNVDVISYLNKEFLPKKNYSVFIAARTNFQKIAQRLNKGCVKIVHLDMSHWIFNNHAAYTRSLSLQKRKGVSLSGRKFQEINFAIEYADFATVLGNSFTISTYSYAQKPIFPLCVPAVNVYPWPENKNYDILRNNYLWLGSSGLVHKGLDLALDAFVEMPDNHLYICGPVQEDKKFENAYYEELYQTTNIHTIGWVDVTSSEFIEIANKCVGLIYPSCAEGQSGAVVTCLQAGLIPIVSYESGVDVNDFGIILNNCSIKEIKNSIQRIARLPAEDLKQMSRKAWEYARNNHTQEKFSETFRQAIHNIIDIS